MNFSKTGKYISLVLLSILNIVFRLPATNHETGIDSFVIHNLATTISTYGSAKWILHPLSFTGLYPLSQASASPFFLSGMSQITGITIEYIILLFCMSLGVLSVFFTFLFAKEVKNDDLFAFIVSFVYSISPLFLSVTIWQATTRNLFMAFFPLFMWALIKCQKSFSSKSIIIATIFLVFLVCSHRLSLFLPFILVAFIAAVILTFTYTKIKHSLELNKFNIDILSLIIFPVVFLLLFFVQFSGIGFYNKYIPEFYSGVFHGTDISIIILNMAAGYFGETGVILFFGLIGFIVLSRTAFDDFGRLYIILCVLILTPLLANKVYTPSITLLFFSILVGFGLVNTYEILNKQRRKAHKIVSVLVLVICIVCSTGFSVFMIDHWHLHADTLSDKTVATATFLKNNANGTSVANTGVLSSQISAFSSKGCLPYGGAYAQYTSPEQLTYGSVNAEEIEAEVVLSPSKIVSGRMLYKLKSVPSYGVIDWKTFMKSFPWANETKIVALKYDAYYIIEDIRLSGKFWYWEYRHSRLLVNLHESGNKIYENGDKDIWQLV